MGRLEQVAVGGAELLTGVGVARWKAWAAVEKCLLKFSIIIDLSVVTTFPCLSPVGSEQWAVGSGQWSVGSEQWAVGSEQWAVGSEQSSYSPWTLQCPITFWSLCYKMQISV
jgi:hypothetical protein